MVATSPSWRKEVGCCHHRLKSLSCRSASMADKKDSLPLETKTMRGLKEAFPLFSSIVRGHIPGGLRSSYAETALSVLVKGLPEMLMRQFEYEDPIVRGGKHLLHSAFFKELVALACDLARMTPLCSTYFNSFSPHSTVNERAMALLTCVDKGDEHFHLLVMSAEK